MQLGVLYSVLERALIRTQVRSLKLAFMEHCLAATVARPEHVRIWVSNYEAIANEQYAVGVGERRALFGAGAAGEFDGVGVTAPSLRQTRTMTGHPRDNRTNKEDKMKNTKNKQKRLAVKKIAAKPIIKDLKPGKTVKGGGSKPGIGSGSN